MRLVSYVVRLQIPSATLLGRRVGPEPFSAGAIRRFTHWQVTDGGGEKGGPIPLVIPERDEQREHRGPVR